MAGQVLHQGATVTCSHGGQATPSEVSSRVMVAGLPIATIAAPYTIAGCPFAPTGGNGPCVSGQWKTGALRVTSEENALAITTGTSTCVPTGTPLLPLDAQTRVIAT
jgi:uncharacterized Zn-binding protein involved in type VI secretion